MINDKITDLKNMIGSTCMSRIKNCAFYPNSFELPPFKVDLFTK